jgi:hypothetical protein
LLTGEVTLHAQFKVNSFLIQSIVGGQDSDEIVLFAESHSEDNCRESTIFVFSAVNKTLSTPTWPQPPKSKDRKAVLHVRQANGTNYVIGTPSTSDCRVDRVAGAIDDVLSVSFTDVELFKSNGHFFCCYCVFRTFCRVGGNQ